MLPLLRSWFFSHINSLGRYECIKTRSGALIEGILNGNVILKRDYTGTFSEITGA